MLRKVIKKLEAEKRKMLRHFLASIAHWKRS